MANTDSLQALALTRMHILFTQAHEQFSTRPDRSNRYVELARAMQTKYRVVWPLELKTKFCSYCGSYLELGKNASRRMKKDHQTIHCNACGKTKMFRLVEQNNRGKNHDRKENQKSRQPTKR